MSKFFIENMHKFHKTPKTFTKAKVQRKSSSDSSGVSSDETNSKNNKSPAVNKLSQLKGSGTDSSGIELKNIKQISKSSHNQYSDTEDDVNARNKSTKSTPSKMSSPHMSSILAAANLSTKKEMLQKILADSNKTAKEFIQKNEFTQTPGQTPKSILKKIATPKSEDSDESQKNLLPLSQGKYMDIKNQESEDSSSSNKSFSRVVTSTQIKSSQETSDDSDSEHNSVLLKKNEKTLKTKMGKTVSFKESESTVKNHSSCSSASSDLDTQDTSIKSMIRKLKISKHSSSLGSESSDFELKTPLESDCVKNSEVSPETSDESESMDISTSIDDRAVKKSVSVTNENRTPLSKRPILDSDKSDLCVKKSTPKKHTSSNVFSKAEARIKKQMSSSGSTDLDSDIPSEKRKNSPKKVTNDFKSTVNDSKSGKCNKNVSTNSREGLSDALTSVSDLEGISQVKRQSVDGERKVKREKSPSLLSPRKRIIRNTLSSSASSDTSEEKNNVIGYCSKENLQQAIPKKKAIQEWEVKQGSSELYSETDVSEKNSASTNNIKESSGRGTLSSDSDSDDQHSDKNIKQSRKGFGSHQKVKASNNRNQNLSSDISLSDSDSSEQKEIEISSTKVFNLPKTRDKKTSVKSLDILSSDSDSSERKESEVSGTKLTSKQTRMIYKKENVTSRKRSSSESLFSDLKKNMSNKIEPNALHDSSDYESDFAKKKMLPKTPPKITSSESEKDKSVLSDSDDSNDYTLSQRVNSSCKSQVVDVGDYLKVKKKYKLYNSLKQFIIVNSNLEQTEYNTELVLDDFSDNDEVWIMQCPKEVQPTSLLGQKIKMDDKVKMKFKVDNKKYECISDSQSKSNCVLTTKSNENLQLSARVINSKGIITVHEVFNKSKVAEIQTPVKDLVKYPMNLKVRHPLFGSSFEEKIELGESIQEKLLEAELQRRKIEAKALKKKRRRSEKSEKEERDQMIFQLLNQTKDSLKLNKSEGGITKRKRALSICDEDKNKKIKVDNSENINVTKETPDRKSPKKRNSQTSKTNEDGDKKHKKTEHTPEVSNVKKKQNKLQVDKNNETEEKQTSSSRNSLCSPKELPAVDKREEHKKKKNKTNEDIIKPDRLSEEITPKVRKSKHNESTEVKIENKKSKHRTSDELEKSADESIVKKSRKHALSENTEYENQKNKNINANGTLDTLPVESKGDEKIKKKKKKKFSAEGGGLQNEVTHKKKKKKRRETQVDNAEIDDTLDGSIEKDEPKKLKYLLDITVENDDVKHKKKKRKHSEISEEADAKIEHKKKKKSGKTNTNIKTSPKKEKYKSIHVANMVNELEHKKKQRKKKRKDAGDCAQERNEIRKKHKKKKHRE